MAGDRPASAVAQGTAVRVMTGAPVPGGHRPRSSRSRASAGPAGASRCSRRSSRARTSAGGGERRRGRGPARGPGRGSIPARSPCSPSPGRDPVPVFRRPRIRVAVTGNELAASGAPAAARSAPRLERARCSRRSAARPLPLGPRRHQARRRRDRRRRRLFERAGGREDLLLTTGGVSAGDLDLLPGEAARRPGFEILFHGVSVRPGKPIALRPPRADRSGSACPETRSPPPSASTSSCGRRSTCLEGDARPGAPRVDGGFSKRRSRRNRSAGDLPGRASSTAAGPQLRAAPLESRGSHDVAAHARANALIRHARRLVRSRRRGARGVRPPRRDGPSVIAPGGPWTRSGARIAASRLATASRSRTRSGGPGARAARHRSGLLAGAPRAREPLPRDALPPRGDTTSRARLPGTRRRAGARTRSASRKPRISARSSSISSGIGQLRTSRFALSASRWAARSPRDALARRPESALPRPRDDLLARRRGRLRPKPWKTGALRAGAVRTRASGCRAFRPPACWRDRPRALEAVSRLTMPKLIVTAEGDWLVDPRARPPSGRGRGPAGRARPPGSTRARSMRTPS